MKPTYPLNCIVGLVRISWNAHAPSWAGIRWRTNVNAVAGVGSALGDLVWPIGTGMDGRSGPELEADTVNESPILIIRGDRWRRPINHWPREHRTGAWPNGRELVEAPFDLSGPTQDSQSGP